MEFARSLLNVWSWLPAFRAVAELEHVHRAAKALNISPSALSRSVRLLESELGAPLFDRAGRGVRLNPRGRSLLHTLRSSMRTLDETLHPARAAALKRPLRISCPAELMATIGIPGAAALLAGHPALSPAFHEHSEGEIPGLLLRGDLDLALVFNCAAREELSVDRIGEVSRSIYRRRKAGPRKGSPSLGAVLELGFVAAVSPASREVRDGWPPELRRRVSLEVESMEHAAAACARGPLLAYLPDALAAHPGWRAQLSRVPLELGQRPAPLFLVRRRQIAPEGNGSAVAEAFRTSWRPSVA